MSGHSKWSSIKHKKAATDAKRGKVFSTIVSEIVVAARTGGVDPDANPRLRMALAKAKEANMPADNIKRAIQRGTGELPGTILEEVAYEGYGPGGVAILVEAVTDNKNRTSSNVRHLFNKGGGNLGEAGCVGWMFRKRGYLSLKEEAIAEDEIFEIALEAGAEDVKTEEGVYEITTSVPDFENVKQAIEGRGLAFEVAEITMLPTTSVKLTGKEARQALRLVENLEEDDDVQQVYANFDISSEDIKKWEAESGE